MSGADSTGQGRGPAPDDRDDRPDEAPPPPVKAGDDWLVGAWSAERWKAVVPQAVPIGPEARGDATPDGDTADGEALAGAMPDGEAADGEALGGEALGGEALGGGAAQGGEAHGSGVRGGEAADGGAQGAETADAGASGGGNPGSPDGETPGSGVRSGDDRSGEIPGAGPRGGEISEGEASEAGASGGATPDGGSWEGAAPGRGALDSGPPGGRASAGEAPRRASSGSGPDGGRTLGGGVPGGEKIPDDGSEGRSTGGTTSGGDIPGLAYPGEVVPDDGARDGEMSDRGSPGDDASRDDASRDDGAVEFKAVDDQALDDEAIEDEALAGTPFALGQPGPVGTAAAGPVARPDPGPAPAPGPLTGDGTGAGIPGAPRPGVPGAVPRPAEIPAAGTPTAARGPAGPVPASGAEAVPAAGPGRREAEARTQGAGTPRPATPREDHSAPPAAPAAPHAPDPRPAGPGTVGPGPGPAGTGPSPRLRPAPLTSADSGRHRAPREAEERRPVPPAAPTPGRPAPAPRPAAAARAGEPGGNHAQRTPAAASGPGGVPPRHAAASEHSVPARTAEADADRHRSDDAQGVPASTATVPVPPVTRPDGAPRDPRPVVAPPEDAVAPAPDGSGGAGLTEDTIVRSRTDRPQGGWRGLLYTATNGMINPGVAPEEIARRDLVRRIRRPLPGPHQIAVSSINGGVGKTTVAACLGLVLAENRGDRVVALDAGSHAGTLAERLTGEALVTVRDLLGDIEGLRSLADVARYTSLARRLQVLASEQDPAMSRAFDRDEYERVCAVLRRFYDIVITDSGAGLAHSAMEGTLSLADSLVIVGTPNADGAGRVEKTLEWLIVHGHGEQVAESVVVLSCDRSTEHIDTERVRRHFEARCRAVVEVPHDPHLATGAHIDLERIRPATHDAFLTLAALLSDRFAATGAARVEV